MGAGPSRAGGDEGFVRVRGAEDDAGGAGGGGGGGGGSVAAGTAGPRSARAAEARAGALLARVGDLAAAAPAPPRDPRAGEAAVTWDSSPKTARRFPSPGAARETDADPPPAFSGRPAASEGGWAEPVVAWLARELNAVDREQARLDEGASQATLLREVMLRARRAKLDTEAAGRLAAADARASVEAAGRCRVRLDAVLKSTEALVRRLELLEDRQGQRGGTS